MKNPYVYETIKAGTLSSPFFDVNLIEQYGQCGEDLIIASLLRAWVEKSSGKIYDLTYLEIGANHPVATSATYLLHHRYGMRGVLVEANPALIAELKKVRPLDTVVHAAVTNKTEDKITLIVPEANELATVEPDFLPAWKYEGAGHQHQVSVKACRINDIFMQYFADALPAFMSVDIEGHDLAILQDMDFEKFSPLIIQVEPSHHPKQIFDFLQQNHYHLVARTDVNMIFIHDSFFQSPLPPAHTQGSFPYYLSKKHQKKPHQRPVKTALKFIKSYFLFPWYVYKTYKKIDNHDGRHD